MTYRLQMVKCYTDFRRFLYKSFAWGFCFDRSRHTTQSLHSHCVKRCAKSVDLIIREDYIL
jgi:hypothetical protein